MKLLKYNLNIKIYLILLFFTFYTVHADDEPEIIIYPPFDHVGLIYEFFANNPSLLYFSGTRFFYLSAEFGSIIKNGNVEDRFTNLTFIMPYNGKEGIVIEIGESQNNGKLCVLDAFLFIYDPIGYESSSRISDKFEQKNIKDIIRSRLQHREAVLRLLGTIRFQLENLESINTILQLVDIKIE